MTDVYLHIDARMADYMATHPYVLRPVVYAEHQHPYQLDVHGGSTDARDRLA